MKLTDLHPQWHSNLDREKAYLEFECPSKHENQGDIPCAIIIPILPTENGWSADGDNFETITIAPSVWHHCDANPHFFIQGGEIIFA